MYLKNISATIHHYTFLSLTSCHIILKINEVSLPDKLTIKKRLQINLTLSLSYQFLDGIRNFLMSFKQICF